MNQTFKKWKKNTIIGCDFGQFGLHVGTAKNCFAGFTPSSSWNLFQAIILCNFQEK